ncbi:MAG: response regulator transcription factor [Bacteroidia bacterium]
MKVLIIEDEIRAVSQLQSALKSCQFDYELLEIIDTVEHSVNWLNENEAPDLIFMDIQLADGLSFEIFNHTTLSSPIIFTTAFDQYAIRAFKVNSIDYLLKPIQKDDLGTAIKKFTQMNKAHVIEPNRLQNLISSLAQPTKRDGILVKSGSGQVRINISDLHFCYSKDSITFGVTSNKRYIIEETLDELYETLDHKEFFKINRGQIVAKSSIKKLEPYFNHRVILSIDHARDQEFIVSRPKTGDFKKWMNA